MALTQAYLVTTKNLEALLNAIVSAEAPERFSNSFLKQLEFTSSNDRLLVSILKGLGFLDDSGIPTQIYFEYLDQTQSRTILAKAIREAYGDLFALNKNANKLSTEEVKNKLKTLTEGKKSNHVLTLMAATFTKLCELAEWTKPEESHTKKLQPTIVEATPEKTEVKKKILSEKNALGLHYNIQIHLPESRDAAVYDAIFRSLKEHLF